MKTRREHTYKDIFACGVLVHIIMRCVEFAEKDIILQYMDFDSQEEFRNVAEAAKSIGLHHEFMMTIQWIQILQNLFFLRCFRGDLYSRTWYRPFDYYISIACIACRILNIVRIY